MKNFDDIIDVLFDGTADEMYDISCTECGGAISYSIAADGTSMTVKCEECGTAIHMGKLAEIPNCLGLFGNTHIFMYERQWPKAQ